MTLVSRENSDNGDASDSGNSSDFSDFRLLILSCSHYYMDCDDEYASSRAFTIQFVLAYKANVYTYLQNLHLALFLSVL